MYFLLFGSIFYYVYLLLYFYYLTEISEKEHPCTFVPELQLGLELN